MAIEWISCGGRGKIPDTKGCTVPECYEIDEGDEQWGSEVDRSCYTLVNPVSPVDENHDPAQGKQAT